MLTTKIVRQLARELAPALRDVNVAMTQLQARFLKKHMISSSRSRDASSGT